mgnify:CR=1 FL=1
MIHSDVLKGRAGKRIAQALLRLRAALSASIPTKTLGDCLVLASWNIRDFGKGKHGGRSAEALTYIAEILSRFDIVAVQEVSADLADLECVRRKLGNWWSCLYTDVTEGVAGNGERLAFLFDSRTVRMSGLAGEIVLPGKKKQPVLQFARTPFTCGFVAGDKQLELCTVHVYWGKSVAVTPERVAEIENVARALAKRAKKRRAPSAPHTLLMGDFNIFNRDDATFAALTKAGFTIPPQLQTIPGSNVAKTKRHYDQLAFLKRAGVLEARAAGVFDFFEHVYRDPVDARLYLTGKLPFRAWRTYQMSDHLPMWVQLEVDGTDELLTRAAGRKK